MKRLRVAHVATVDVSLRYLLLNQMKAVQAAGFDVTGISASGPDVAAVESAGIRFIPVEMSRRSTPWRDLHSLIRLVRIFRRERFDIVHTHTPKAALLGQYAALLARTPIRVHTIHGLYFPGHMKPRRRWMFVLLERITMLFSHRNLSQNPEDIPVAIQEKISRPDRIEFLGNGIDVTAFDPAIHSSEERAATRSALGIGPEHVVVGMVARFVVEKGYRELIEAAKLIRDALPHARFLFIGSVETSKDDALHPSLIAEAGLGDVVQFLGQRADMPQLYAAMDLLTLPSHREGFPRAPMEAAAAGLPSVVTDVRGCRQTVTDGVTGTIVPPRNPAALATALMDLIGDGEKRARFGKAARAKALAEFDERIVFGRVVDAYNRLLASRPVPP